MVRGTTLAGMLEQRALAAPTRPFIVMDGDDSRSFGEFNTGANQLAHGLMAAGVGRGDRVAIMLPNTLEHLLTGYALRKIGAVEVAIHTRSRGAGLAHVLRTSAPTLIVIDESLAPCLADIETPEVIIAILGDPTEASRILPNRVVISFADLDGRRSDNPGIDVHDAEVATILFTSGTTGPSKGCVLSHRYAVTMGENIARAFGFTEDDGLYCPFPMSHVDSPCLTVAPALLTGGRAAIGRRFSVSGFWDEVRRFNATVFDFMGATLTMLHNVPERPNDHDNPVRLAWGAPVPAFAPTFERRFGLKLVSGYGLTDAGMVCWSNPDAEEPIESCGRPLSPYELRIGDEWDDPVPVGSVGEILVRTSESNVMMQGYFGMPEATARVFGNGWLHTGDYGRLDNDGRLFFEGRKSESIRSKGENISSWEVEQVLESHPDVLEAVAIGVPSPLSEEDVHAFIVLKAGSTIGVEDLRSFARGRMADFMVPATIDFIDSIPKTETGKPEKFRLRQLAHETSEPLAPTLERRDSSVAKP